MRMTVTLKATITPKTFFDRLGIIRLQLFKVSVLLTAEKASESIAFLQFLYLAREVVLVHENVFQAPHLEAVDMAELAFPVEVLPAILTFLDEFFWKLSKQLHTLSQVIFTTVIVFTRSEGGGCRN